MDAHTVELEIPLRWWLWRGHVYDTPGNSDDEQLQHYWSSPRDPLDDADYDESRAFPSIKPHFDVFGPWSRTRKQRGWVQVKQRRRPEPLHLTYQEDHTHRATAADIPPELFDTILAYLFTLCGNKRVLSSIALVCRRWASIMQPRIFWMVTLRDWSDVEALRTFTLPQRSRVAGYIREVKLSLDVTEHTHQPWVHTFCSILVPRLHVATKSHPWNISLEVLGPLPNGRMMKGIHDMLPKPLISWMSQGITTLKLTALSFRNFAALPQMLQSFPTLYFVDLDAIAWRRAASDKRPVTAYLSASPRLLHEREISYSLQGCSDNAVSTWLSILLAPNRADKLDEEEAELLCCFGSALVQNIAGTRFPNWAMRSVRLARAESDYSEFWATHDKRDLTASVRVCYTPRVPGQGKRVQIISVDFTWESCHPVPDIIGFTDWSTVDTVVQSLSGLQIFVVHLETLDEVALFHNDVVKKHMPHLMDSRRLKYTRVISRSAEQKHVTKWTQVGCVDGKVQDIGRPLLNIDFHRLL